MSFELIQNVYRAKPLEQFDWLEHGFGTLFSPVPESLATLRQIHSDIAIYADRSGCLAEGDALLSDRPGCLVGVKTADCLPILLADERRRVVAAVHAGWRGSVARIAQKAIDQMAARWDTKAEDLHAAIGPGIGVCCFEVGPEVAAQFGHPFRRMRVDLEEHNRRQLVEAGLRPERIYTSGLCTFCRADQFHSFRRDPEQAGRMISVIGVRQETARARE